MTPGRGIVLFVWTLTICSEAVLCWILNFRPGRKQYPAFRVFISFCLFRSAILYAINAAGDHTAYFYAYYIGAILESAIKVVIIWEVTKELFLPSSILPGDSYVLIQRTVTGITFVCIVSALMFPSQYPHVLFATARVMDRTLTLVMACYVWGILLFAARLGIPLRKRLEGILAGFAFDLSVNSVVLIATTSATQTAAYYCGLLVVFSGAVAMNTWTYFFLLPEPVLLESVKPCSHEGCKKKPVSSAFLKDKKRIGNLD